MATYLGVDGFRSGWVGVFIDDDGAQRFDYSHSLERLICAPHSMAMIDMPIGLPSQGHRRCDREARKLLGPAVFPGVRRDYWNFDNQTEANNRYWANEDYGISTQLWAIRKKVREVDELMTPARQRTVRETHPELLFWRLNDNTTLPNKKTEQGRIQRIAILKAQGFDRVDTWLMQRTGTGIGRDDLIDACACAIVARQSVGKLPSDDSPLDAKGLRMEMWF